MLEITRKEKMMIPKNRITTSILTGASVASATVILSLFEPDRLVLPAVLLAAILIFSAPYLTFGRSEGVSEGRAYHLAAVVAGIATGLVILGQPTEGRLIPTIAEAAQQGGSMLATGLAGWALWRAGARSMPTLPDVLNGKIVWATSAAAGYFLLPGTLSIILLEITLLTIHYFLRAKYKLLQVDLNFSQIISVQGYLMMNMMLLMLRP
jgi:membrane protein